MFVNMEIIVRLSGLLRFSVNAGLILEGLSITR
jgi:hypothetical protein